MICYYRHWGSLESHRLLRQVPLPLLEWGWLTVEQRSLFGLSEEVRALLLWLWYVLRQRVTVSMDSMGYCCERLVMQLAPVYTQPLLVWYRNIVWPHMYGAFGELSDSYAQ